MIKLLAIGGLFLTAASFCFAQELAPATRFRFAPIIVIKNTSQIIQENNIEIPIKDKNEAIRFAKALPAVKEYLKQSAPEKLLKRKFDAVFKDEDKLWAVTVSPGNIDSWWEVEFPPDCSYVNIYSGMGG